MFKLSLLSPALRQFVCVEIANLSVICLGMSVVWASPMVIKLRDEEQTILPRPITEDEAAWIVSTSLLTGLFGVAISGIIMDKLGRKTAILFSFVPRIIFCFLAIFATDYWMLLVARSFAGISDMLALTAISTYISEIASKEIRGASGTMTQINSAVGMLIMFGVGPFISYLALNLLMTGIIVAAFIPLLFIPESPFFLYTKGKTNKSIEVLTFLYGTEELAHEELKRFSTDTDETVNKLELFKDRTNIKTFFMVLLLAVGLQINGYNVVNLYLQTIFESANTSVSSEISSLIIGVIQLFSCSICFFLTNQFTRKTIICSSLAAIFVGMVGLGTFFTLEENGTQIKGILNFLPLASAAIVIFGYNAGLGSLFWILIAELLYGPVRPYGMSLGGFIMTITGFTLSLLFPTLNSAIGLSGTYWLFSAGCALVCLYIAVFVPETKGRTFAEIQTALGRRGSTVKDMDLKA